MTSSTSLDPLPLNTVDFEAFFFFFFDLLPALVFVGVLLEEEDVAVMGMASGCCCWCEAGRGLSMSTRSGISSSSVKSLSSSYASRPLCARMLKSSSSSPRGTVGSFVPVLAFDRFFFFFFAARGAEGGGSVGGVSDKGFFTCSGTDGEGAGTRAEGRGGGGGGGEVGKETLM